MARRSINGVTTDDLRAELRRRQRRLPALERKRKQLLTKLEGIEAEIGSIDGAATSRRRGRAGAGRTRPRNEQTLAEAITKVLKPDKPMSVTGVAEAVQRAGYKTHAANFYTIVNQTLLREKKQFKKMGRGQYALAKGSG